MREELLEGGFVELFEVRGGAEAGVEIVLKVAAKVDLVEGIDLFVLRFAGNFLGAALAVALLAGALVEGLGGLIDLL